MRTEKQKTIFNRVKNKKNILFAFLFLMLISFPMLVQGRALDLVDIKYKPNVPIPITIGGYNFAEEIIIGDDGTFLASYIAGIYQYAAGFAGIVAMFMLVIAGWRWLMAAGNAQKINASKDMVNGVLIGLALIFGGQLLLSQISEDFNYIDSLNIAMDPETLGLISQYDANVAFCNPTSTPPIEDCSDYKTEEQCRNDICGVAGDDTGDYDEICVPLFNGQIPNLTFDECDDCWPSWIGTCDQYNSSFDMQNDPCDYDGDGKGGHITDPDGCKDHTNSNVSPSSRGVPQGIPQPQI